MHLKRDRNWGSDQEKLISLKSGLIGMSPEKVVRPHRVARFPKGKLSNPPCSLVPYVLRLASSLGVELQ